MAGTRGDNDDIIVNKPDKFPAVMRKRGKTKVRSSISQIFMSCHKYV